MNPQFDATKNAPVPQVMGADGKLMGARMAPSGLSLCCTPACAISGYVTGDPTDGSMEGPALTACLLNCFCICVGSLYALLSWKPDPSQIKNDGTQRTLNNRCMAVCCLGGPFAIAFWQSGDACTDCCNGDAGIACMLNVAGHFFGVGPLGDCYACCFWQPNPAMFRRLPQMHGSRDQQNGDVVGGAGAVQAVAQAVGVAVAVAVPAVAVPAGTNKATE